MCWTAAFLVSLSKLDREPRVIEVELDTITLAPDFWKIAVRIMIPSDLLQESTDDRRTPTDPSLPLTDPDSSSHHPRVRLRIRLHYLPECSQAGPSDVPS